MRDGPHPCRSCGGDRLTRILSLGETPLANAFLTTQDLERLEPAYPLDVAFCPDCTLVQLTETVPPEQLFTEYLYFSSFSDTMLRHARELAMGLIDTCQLGPGSLVIEVASNDGYLLKNYADAGIPVLGIEPAANVARVAREERGITTLCEFFDRRLAEKLSESGQRADLLHAHNVLAHVPDLNGFVGGVRVVLKDDGIAVIEVPYVKDMIDRCEFDTIYHEHLCYFSFTALERLFSRHGLDVEDVERIEIHGGSLRLVVGRGRRRGGRVDDLLAEEAAWGVHDLPFYLGFAERVEGLKSSLRGLLDGLRNDGRRLAAYGAAAKGTTLLNYVGLGRETLDFVVDRSTYKQGRYVPGVRLPIYSPEKLLEAMPEYVLLLTWNLAEEILEQQAEYRRRGGRFIVPLPEPEVVS